MGWSDLFERAEAYDVTVEDVREALDEHRARRRDSD